jgi:16S rRNA (uracil1498-N3)-methyltransferase
MNLFYAPGLNEADAFYTLDQEESNHCFRSMRRATGQSISLTNGCGLLAEGVISGNEAGRCLVQIIKNKQEMPNNWKLQMAVAPTKNQDRFEWFSEKASEIGIDSIVPLICEHSERTRVPHDRLNRLLVAAMKQSLKSYLPLLFPEITFQSLLSQGFAGQKFIAWCGEDKVPHLKFVLEKAKDVLILIGPEGDFSPDEVSLAKEYGFIPVSLGKNRLRTETAAIVACHTVNLINE